MWLLRAVKGWISIHHRSFSVALHLSLSPRKLHPVLRAERAKKDRFATGQKNYFFGCFMNVILDVVK